MAHQISIFDEIIVDNFAGGGGASTGIELAQGFPSDYQIEFDYNGKPYSKKEQVARCGNAVCPPMAEAVVRANLPEYAARGTITTMEELEKAMVA